MSTQPTSGTTIVNWFAGAFGESQGRRTLRNTAVRWLALPMWRYCCRRQKLPARGLGHECLILGIEPVRIRRGRKPAGDQHISGAPARGHWVACVTRVVRGSRCSRAEEHDMRSRRQGSGDQADSHVKRLIARKGTEPRGIVVVDANGVFLVEGVQPAGLRLDGRLERGWTSASERCGQTANELSREAPGPKLAPSINAWAQAAFPELRTDRPCRRLTTSAGLDPNRTSGLRSLRRHPARANVGGDAMNPPRVR